MRARLARPGRPRVTALVLVLLGLATSPPAAAQGSVRHVNRARFRQRAYNVARDEAYEQARARQEEQTRVREDARAEQRAAAEGQQQLQAWRQARARQEAKDRQQAEARARERAQAEARAQREAEQKQRAQQQARAGERQPTGGPRAQTSASEADRRRFQQEARSGQGSVRASGGRAGEPGRAGERAREDGGARNRSPNAGPPGELVPPPRGTKLTELSPGAVQVEAGAEYLFYDRGAFYRYDERAGRYDEATPPAGTAVPARPEEARRVRLAGTEYYEYEGVYYRAVYREGEIVWVVADVAR